MKVGLVDLRDLASARPWGRRYLPELVAALGVVPGEQTFTQREPMPAMIAVLSRASMYRWGAWLKDVPHAIIVVDERAEPPPEDAEVRALDDAELREAVGARHRFISWDGAPASVAALRQGLAELAASTARAAHNGAPAAPRAPVLAPGDARWREVPIAPWPAARLASRLFLRGDRAVVARDDGAYVDLVDGTVGAERERGAGDGDVAFAPDGTVGVRRAGGAFELFDVRSGAALAHLEPGRELPFFVDARAGLAAAGWRCTFSWLGVDVAHGVDGAPRGALAALCGCVHDWPAGHAKKLFGYDDNHPRRLSVAPDGGAYVSTFDRDAVLSGAVPFRWRRATFPGGGADVALLEWPPEDALRKVLFVPDFETASLYGGHTDARAEPPLEVLAREEDARGHAPVVVPGPDDERRYALALHEEVWTVRAGRARDEGGTGDDVAERVGGPHEGWALFDASHRVVRRGRERLLGGDAHALLLLDPDTHELVREDVDTGARTVLSVERALIDHALPVGGRFVLVGARDDDAADQGAPLRLRIV